MEVVCSARTPHERSRPPVIEEAKNTVLKALVESTLILGTSDLRIHIATGEVPILIVDLWGENTRKQRQRDFLNIVGSKGFVVDIRKNPEVDVPVDSWLFHKYSNWDTVELGAELLHALKECRLNIQKNALLKGKKGVITLDPSVARGWITTAMSSSVEIRSIDFPEVRRRAVRGQRAVAVVSCHFLPSKLDQALAAANRMADQFGIDVLLNPIPRQISLKEKLQKDFPAIAERTTLQEADIPELKRILQTVLKWRTHKHALVTEDLSAAPWFSIDTDYVMLREDLIRPFRVDGTLKVNVAIPDSTVPLKMNGAPEMDGTSKRAPGVFFLGRKTAAWVHEFEVHNGALTICRDPRRAFVCNYRQCVAGDTSLEQDELYRQLKRALNCKSDYAVVEMLMHAAGRSNADFLKRNGYPFLVRKTREEGAKLLRNLLAESYPVNARTLRTKSALVDLILRIQNAGRIELLPPLIAHLNGDTIVCESADERCHTKSLQGSRSIINQWIIATAVEGRREGLPDFIKDIFSKPARAVDAGVALDMFEQERKFAGLLRLIIRVLSCNPPYRASRVISVKRGRAVIRVQGMKFTGILEDPTVKAGDNLIVTPVSFNLKTERFQYAQSNNLSAQSFHQPPPHHFSEESSLNGRPHE